MTVLQGARVRRPVCRLHERQSDDPADFPLPTGRQEEWRFTPLHSSAKGTISGQWRLRSAPSARRLTLCVGS
jgi:hypothetical protein